MNARIHQPMTSAPQPSAAAMTPTAVHTSGEMPRRTDAWMMTPSLRVYQYFNE